MSRCFRCPRDTSSNKCATRRCVGRHETQRAGRWRPALSTFARRWLFDFPWALFAVALSGQCFLLTALFTWFQVERVTFDFLHNVCLLHCAFKATQRAFQSFAVLQMYFCQLIHHLPVRIVSGRPQEAASETQRVYCSVFPLLERR